MSYAKLIEEGGGGLFQGENAISFTIFSTRISHCLFKATISIFHTQQCLSMNISLPLQGYNFHLPYTTMFIHEYLIASSRLQFPSSIHKNVYQYPQDTKISK